MSATTAGIQYRHLSLIGSRVRVSLIDGRDYIGTLTNVVGTVQIALVDSDRATIGIAGSMISTIQEVSR